jgi:hypothetical protein
MKIESHMVSRHSNTTCIQLRETQKHYKENIGEHHKDQPNFIKFGFNNKTSNNLVFKESGLPKTQCNGHKNNQVYKIF